MRSSTGSSVRLRAACAALGLFACGPLLAQAPEAVDETRTIAPGETLNALARRELDHVERWRDVADYNGIRDPRRIRPGTVVRIKPEWLRNDPIAATVDSIGGAATIDGKPATVGGKAVEGSLIETGAGGTAVLVLSDGTKLRLPPASRVRIERLRGYHSDEAIEARIQLEKGGIETMSPPARRRALEIRSPAGNAAVRGTDFRMRAEPKDSFIEVLTGRIAAASPRGDTSVGAREGAVVSPARSPLVEKLLAAPDLGAIDGRAYRTVEVVLDLPPVAQAAGYQVELARDPAFRDLVFSRRQPVPALRLATDRDGPLFLRLRGVSAVGLEGLEKVARIEIAARPVAPQPLRPAATDQLLDGPVEFAWTEGAPGLRYRLQLAADPGFGQLLGETVTDGARATLALPPAPAGTRYWRVAAIEGPQREGPFSPPQPFGQRLPATIERAVPKPLWRDGSGEPIGSGSGGLVVPGYAVSP